MAGTRSSTWLVIVVLAAIAALLYFNYDLALVRSMGMDAVQGFGFEVPAFVQPGMPDRTYSGSVSVDNPVGPKVPAESVRREFHWENTTLTITDYNEAGEVVGEQSFYRSARKAHGKAASD